MRLKRENIHSSLLVTCTSLLDRRRWRYGCVEEYGGSKVYVWSFVRREWRAQLYERKPWLNILYLVCPSSSLAMSAVWRILVAQRNKFGCLLVVIGEHNCKMVAQICARLLLHMDSETPRGGQRLDMRQECFTSERHCDLLRCVIPQTNSSEIEP